MTALTPNAQYNVAAPMSLPIRIAAYARRQMFDRFLRSTDIRPAETLLDVGVTSDQTYEASNRLGGLASNLLLTLRKPAN